MNNKILMSVIAVIITILLAVLLIWGASSCDARTNPGYVEGENFKPEAEGETSEDNSSIYGIEDSIFDELGEGELIGGFEGSDLPSGNSSNGNNVASSESSSAQSSSSSGNNVSLPSSGNGSSSGSTSSRPSSGSSSSAPSIEDAEQDGEITYEEYMAMSGKDQEAYMKSFESIAAFFDWFNAVKDKYEKENPSIEIGDGPIDMNDIINGGNG